VLAPPRLVEAERRGEGARHRGLVLLGAAFLATLARAQTCGPQQDVVSAVVHRPPGMEARWLEGHAGHDVEVCPCAAGTITT
jgi:hypothetical protein